MKNQMNIRIIFSLVLFLISNISIAQNSIGINFGVPKYTWSNDANAPFIISEATGSYAVGLEFQKNIQKSITWGLDVSIHRITNTIRTNTDYSSYSAGSTPFFNLGITPKLIYNKEFGESKFGGFLSVGPSIQWNNGNDRELNETNFRIVGKRELNPSGDWNTVPLEQTPYSAQEKANSWSVVIRPEAGLTFRASKYSKFTARFQYGVGIGQPLILQEFNNFQLEGILSNSKHKLKGDFWAIQLGYQILLK
ncbi:hypothetical protein [Algoriphagus sp. AK58]|uniref:hypothetical protein n=1 Tax=Algoriphagus sp. AK58 TaxID=1406877 RepID=UPI00164FA61B|nr:hypothetical protein [Algoriphagus sp. AK58]